MVTHRSSFVVLARDAQLGEADIQAYPRSEGPAYQFSRRVFFLDTLPLAGTNKIDRNALIDHAAPVSKTPKVAPNFTALSLALPPVMPYLPPSLWAGA